LQSKVKCLQLYREGDLLTDDTMKAEMSQGFSLPFSQKG